MEQNRKCRKGKEIYNCKKFSLKRNIIRDWKRFLKKIHSGKNDKNTYGKWKKTL